MAIGTHPGQRTVSVAFTYYVRPPLRNEGHNQNNKLCEETSCLLHSEQ